MAIRIGKLIRKRRKELHMTQKELAMAMGLEDTGMISKYELGQSLPPVDVICALAKALNTTRSYFLDEISDENNDVVREIIGLVNCVDEERQKLILKVIKPLCA